MAGEPGKPGREGGAPQDPTEPQDPGAAKADATLSAASCIDCELARPALDAMRADALRPVLPAYAGTINRPAYEGHDLQVSPCANGEYPWLSKPMK